MCPIFGHHCHHVHAPLTFIPLPSSLAWVSLLQLTLPFDLHPISPLLPFSSPLLRHFLQVCAGGLVPAGATGSLPPGALSSPHILKHPPTLRKLSQVVDVVAKDGSSPLIIAAMGGHIEV